MKKIIALALMFCSIQSFSQIEMGVRTGLNISTIKLATDNPNIDVNIMPLYGFQFGIYGKMNFTEKLSIVPELIIQNKGNSHTDHTYYNSQNVEKIHDTYLSMPISLVYDFYKEYKVMLGIEGGYLISYENSNYYITIFNDDDDEYRPKRRNNFDLNLVLGFRKKFLTRFFADVRYVYGLIDVSPNNSSFQYVTREYDWFNDDFTETFTEVKYSERYRMFQFSLGYKIR